MGKSHTESFRSPSRESRKSNERLPTRESSDGFDSLFSEDDSGKAKNFKVVVRVRPRNHDEERREEPVVCFVDSTSTITCAEADDSSSASPNSRPYTSDSGSSRRRGAPRTFAYDRVFSEHDPQQLLYETAIAPVVLSTVEGYNGSIIAYGQTGTGKTYTIEGEQGDERGIIPRAVADIFNHIHQTTTETTQYLVRVSFLQIYNEKVADLLNPDSLRRLSGNDDSLNLRDDPGGGVYVEGLTETVIKSSQDALECLAKGSMMRTTAATNMNRSSSRSHAVFTITTEKSEPDGAGGVVVTVGKLCLVDLAGSERVKSTGITLADGKRMDEAKNINSSLSAFGKVVLALTSGGNQHVPYRDSKLTRILQGSVGGNCKTTMITTVGPSASAYAETVSSLKFATRAKKIKNYAVVNQDLTDQTALAQYQKEILRLRQQLAEKHASSTYMHGSADSDHMRSLQQRATEAELTAQAKHERLLLREREIEAERKEKSSLLQRIEELESQILDSAASPDGTNPEVFRKAVAEAEARFLTKFEEEYKRKKTVMGKEREALRKEREQLDLDRARLEQAQRALIEDRRAFEEEKAAYERHSRSSIEIFDEGAQGEAMFTRRSPSPTEKPNRTRVHEPEEVQGQLALPPEVDLIGYDDEAPRRQPEVTSSMDFDVYMRALRHPVSGIPLHDARFNHQYIRNVFTGENAAAWFQQNMEGVDTMELATSIGQKFVDWGTVVALDGDGDFHPTTNLYKFMDTRKSAVRPKTPVRIRSPERRPSTTGNAARRRSASSSEDPRDRPISNTSKGSNASKGSTSSDDGAGRASTHDGGSLSPQAPSSDRPKSSRFRRFTRRFSATTAVGTVDETETAISPAPPAMPRRMSISSMRPHSASATSTRPTTSHSLETAYSEAEATLLHSAAGQGDRAAIRSFLQTFDVDCTDNQGRTPLMYACTANKVKAVELLIRSGANVAAEDSDGRTALLWAAYYGYHDVLRVLLRQESALVAHAGPDGRTALHWASKHPDTRCLDVLLRSSTLDTLNRTDVEHQTVLHWAVLCKSHECVRKLLRAGADIKTVDDHGRTAIHYAVVNTAVECLVALLEFAPECVNLSDRKGRTALHLAVAQDGAFDAVLLLLSCPETDVDAVDVRKTTPLHWAAVCGATDICKALFARGSKLNIRDANGMTALHHASEKGHTEAVKALQRLAASGSQGEINW